jgi:predicted SnoaL-like aldol condensation-catalyzing enzyme
MTAGADGLSGVANAEDFVERFTVAWKEKDPAKLAALFHPGATVRQPPVRRAFGAHEVAEYFKRVFAVMPDIELTPVAWAARGDVVLIEWRIAGGTPTGPVSWGGVDRFKLDQGLAVDEQVYFDTLPLWERLDPSMQRPDLVSLD